MSDYVNTFEDFGFSVPATAKPDEKGNVYVTCPVCDPYRKKKGEKKLSVHIERCVWNCHHCGWHGNLTSRSFVKDKPNFAEKELFIPMDERIEKYFVEKRKINRLTLDVCDVRCAMKHIRQKDNNGELKKVLSTAFIYRQNGYIMMIKYRDSKKNFSIEDKSVSIPWGLDWIRNEKECFIVEGEIDRLSMHQAGFYNTISVPTGTTISPKERKHYEETGKLIIENHLNLSYFDSCYEYFDRMDTIYIATDDDAPGIKLRMEIARRFGASKCKFIRWSQYTYQDESGKEKKCKDANDVHVNLGEEILRNCKDNFETFPIDNVITIEDDWEALNDRYVNGLVKGKSTGYNTLDPHFNWRFGHTVAINGYPNNGKTVFAFNMIVLSAMLYDWKWAAYCPENYPTADLYSMLIEIFIGKTMELGYSNRVTKSDMELAKTFIKRHIELINNENGFTPEELRNLTKQLIMQKGIVGFYKDPWNALNHNMGGLSLDNYLEQELSAEVRLAVNHNIINLIAVHPPTPKDEDRKNPPAPSMFQITGGGVWSKKIYDILCVHIHNKQDIEDTSTEIHVQKTKWHKLVGLPTRNNPVILNFQRSSNRYLEGPRNPFLNGRDNSVPVNQMEMFSF